MPPYSTGRSLNAVPTVGAVHYPRSNPASYKARPASQVIFLSPDCLHICSARSDECRIPSRNQNLCVTDHSSGWRNDSLAGTIDPPSSSDREWESQRQKVVASVSGRTLCKGRDSVLQKLFRTSSNPSWTGGFETPDTIVSSETLC